MSLKKFATRRIRSLLTSEPTATNSSSTTTTTLYPPPRPLLPHPRNQSCSPPVPYTLYEALYGCHGLEDCVSQLWYNWSPSIQVRLRLFTGVISRPKQALHHLLELLSIYLCCYRTSSSLSSVQYLADAMHDLIPSDTVPQESVQWHAATTYINSSSVRTHLKSIGRSSKTIPQKEEAFPLDSRIDAQSIMRVITTALELMQTNTHETMEDNISSEELKYFPGYMDEPAKTAAIVYAWFLNDHHIPNGWLRRFIFSNAVGRRERPPQILESHRNINDVVDRARQSPGKKPSFKQGDRTTDSNLPNSKLSNSNSNSNSKSKSNSNSDSDSNFHNNYKSSDILETTHIARPSRQQTKNQTNDNIARFIRRREELHTLFAPPFLDHSGHLCWYTVRSACAPRQVIGRRAASYARANQVRIDSCVRLARSVQIHPAHLCNAPLLHFPLWMCWSHGARSVGAHTSLAPQHRNAAAAVVTGLPVAFSDAVHLDMAIAAGFRVIDGTLVDPDGNVRLIYPVKNSRGKLFTTEVVTSTATDQTSSKDGRIQKPVPCRRDMMFS